jgi:hypothetical protein
MNKNIAISSLKTLKEDTVFWGFKYLVYGKRKYKNQNGIRYHSLKTLGSMIPVIP